MRIANDAVFDPITVDISLIKRRVTEILFEHSGGEVQSGPFQGMVIPRERSWPDGNEGIMILGCYEQELHGIIGDEIDNLNDLYDPKIVNLGCAEGYYAIGLARRIPHASVWVYDINLTAIDIARRAATENCVSINYSSSIDMVLERSDLIVSDCEFGELEYLDPVKHPTLSDASIIVECHNTPGRSISDILTERFTDTHNIVRIDEGGRNPNEFEFLRQWDSVVRWIAVNEGRPTGMPWLYMVPK